MTVFAKDPDATLDYSIDWSAYLADGETLSTSDWSVEPAETGGLAVLAAGVQGATSQVTVGGGISGHSYRLVNRISTNQSRTDERSITIRAMDR